MTTISTYQSDIKKIGGASKLPKGAKQAHDLLVEVTDNFTDQDLLKEVMDEDPNTKKMVDTLMATVNSLLSKGDKPKKPNTRPPKAAKFKVGDKVMFGTATFTVKEVKRDNGAWLYLMSNGAEYVESMLKKAPKKSTSKRKLTTKKGPTGRSGRTGPAGVKVKPKAITTRNVKTPDLQVLTRFKNLPKQERSYLSIVRFDKQVKNGIAKKIYLDHAALIKTISSKLGKLVKAFNGTPDAGMVKISVSDSGLFSRIEKALSSAKPRLQVNFLAGVDTDIDWDWLEENHPDYYGSDRVAELLDLGDYFEGEKTLKDIGYSSKKDAEKEYKRLANLVVKEAGGKLKK